MKTHIEKLKANLFALLPLEEIPGSIFHSEYHDAREYSSLMALSIAKAIFEKNTDKLIITVINHGLN